MDKQDVKVTVDLSSIENVLVTHATVLNIFCNANQEMDSELAGLIADTIDKRSDELSKEVADNMRMFCGPLRHRVAPKLVVVPRSPKSS